MPMPAPPPMKAALRRPLPFLVRARLLVSMRYWVPFTSNRVSVSAITDFPLNIPRLWATRTSPRGAEPAGHGNGIAFHHRLGQDPVNRSPDSQHA
jgi:hypothetical protein